MAANGPLQPSLVESLLDPNTVRGLNIIIAQLRELGAAIPGASGSIGSPQASATGGSGSSGSSGESLSPAVSVSLPIPVSALEMVQSTIASGNLGHATPNTARLPITVAAGGSYTFTNSPPEGYVWVLAAPLLIFADQHDKAILVSGIVDGDIIVNDFAMVADANEQIAQYVAITKSLQITVTNGTSAPVTITPETQYAKVLNRIYFNRIQITVQDGDALLDQYAAAASKRLSQGVA